MEVSFNAEEERISAQLQQHNLLKNSFRQMRYNGILCDVSLNFLDEKTLRAHRLLLAASSPFFYAMFTNGMRETFEESANFPNFHSKIMNIIMNFIYSGSIDESMDRTVELKHLLYIADYLQISPVTKICSERLLEKLSLDNYLKLWRIAEFQNNNFVKKKVISFIAKHLQEASETNDFKFLPLELLISVITNSNVKLYHVETRVNAVNRWVSYDEKRSSLLEFLVSYASLQDFTEDTDENSSKTVNTEKNETVNTEKKETVTAKVEVDKVRWFAGLLRCMDNFRKNLILTDFAFICEGKEIPVHRVVLAASSSYFLNLFAENHSKNSPTKMVLPNITPNIMETVLGFIYTGSVRMPYKETSVIKQFVSAAIQLQITNLYKYCSSLLLRILSKDNFLEVWNLANDYNFDALKFQVCMFAAKNFLRLSTKDMFLSVSPEFLIEILKQDEMINQCTDSTFLVILKWVRNSPEDREPCLQSLLPLIDFDALSDACLQHVIYEDPLIDQSFQLLKQITKILSKKYFTSQADESPDYKKDCRLSAFSQNLQSHTSTFDNQRFFLMKLDSFNNGFYRWYYPRSRIATDTFSFKFPLLLDSAVCHHNGMIYFAGGRNKTDEACDAVYIFNIVLRKWIYITPLQQARYAAGAVEMKGFIYVAGGIDSRRKELNGFERYNPLHHCWTTLTPMLVKRKEPRLVNGGDKLYAIGSFMGNWGSPMEYYDPTNNQWTSIVMYTNLIQVLRQRSCHFVKQNEDYHIFARSNEGTVYWYTKKDTTDCFEFNKTKWNTSKLLAIATVEGSIRSTLYAVNDLGTIWRFSYKDYKWTEKICLLPQPNYSIFIGNCNEISNLI